MGYFLYIVGKHLKLRNGCLGQLELCIKKPSFFITAVVRQFKIVINDEHRLQFLKEAKFSIGAKNHYRISGVCIIKMTALFHLHILRDETPEFFSIM